MDDMISRKALVDALAKWDWQDLYLPIHFLDLIEDLPSVPLGVEQISREAAINAVIKNEIFEWDEIKQKATLKEDSVLAVLKAIKELPSVLAKQGIWISEGAYADGADGEVFHCSKCGFTGIDVNTYNFCPSCGARMSMKEEIEWMT